MSIRYDLYPESFTKDKLIEVIDSCAETGGKIVFNKGEYVLSTVFLKSNVNIILEDGALIYGAESFYDYEPEEKYDYPLYQDSSHSNFNCSMFVAKNCDNISITGKGVIDMRSVWDEDGVRGVAIKHRGAKCITLKECKNVEISGITVKNATDLAIYFTACDNVKVFGVKMRVYIDGISPDNSKNVKIYDCDIETGDDGIVFKSSYNLNRLDVCENIEVYNCRIKSRCNAVKFGTESNGGFKHFYIHDIDIRETRITGISIESVDGGIIDDIVIKNINMRNVNAPLFIHLGNRLRGPKGTKIGSISNVTVENVTAKGPYVPYEIIEWNYFSYKSGTDKIQDPKIFGVAENFNESTAVQNWQFTSNVCGLKGYDLKNITLKNFYFELDGGVTDYSENVPEEAQDYPEVFVYGRTLPASGLYLRHIDGLKIENVVVKTDRKDNREPIVMTDVK